jgi:hypothetical protein
MGGDAKQKVGTDLVTHFIGGGVILTDVDPVGATRQGYVGAIVKYEKGVVGVAELTEASPDAS